MAYQLEDLGWFQPWLVITIELKEHLIIVEEKQAPTDTWGMCQPQDRGTSIDMYVSYGMSEREKECGKEKKNKTQYSTKSESTPEKVVSG